MFIKAILKTSISVTSPPSAVKADSSDAIALQLYSNLLKLDFCNCFLDSF